MGIVKTCSCGRAYTAAQWKRLPLVGPYDDDVRRYELRNCACKSTIAIDVGVSPGAPMFLSALSLDATFAYWRALRGRGTWRYAAARWRELAATLEEAELVDEARSARETADEAEARAIIEETVGPRGTTE
jgi:hypothetical protein